MYIPREFEVTDLDTIHSFIEENSFATLVSNLNGQLMATHLPLLLHEGRILGHVAKANPHWRAFGSQSESLAIFEGPHAYVSPAWYTTQPAVPTWNYAVVHAYGVARLMDDGELAEFLDRLTQRYESQIEGANEPYVVSQEHKAERSRAIVGFTFDVPRFEAKFKLSQNRSHTDQQRVLEHLETSERAVDRDLARLTKSRIISRRMEN